MGATDRFSPEDVQRIVGLTRKQLDYWDRLRLVSPREQQGTRYYDFRDLIGLRTIKQLLEKGVSANRLQRALSALNQNLDQVQAPLSQLRILSYGKDVVVEQGSARLEPVSGQFVLNFETRELDESIRFVTRHRPSDWFAIAVALISLTLLPVAFARPSKTCRMRSPSTAPGRIALARMLCSPSSIDRVFMNPISPHFTVE